VDPTTSKRADPHGFCSCSHCNVLAAQAQQVAQAQWRSKAPEVARPVLITRLAASRHLPSVGVPVPTLNVHDFRHTGALTTLLCSAPFRWPTGSPALLATNSGVHSRDTRVNIPRGPGQTVPPLAADGRLACSFPAAKPTAFCPRRLPRS